MFYQFNMRIFHTEYHPKGIHLFLLKVKEDYQKIVPQLMMLNTYSR